MIRCIRFSLSAMGPSRCPAEAGMLETMSMSAIRPDGFGYFVELQSRLPTVIVFNDRLQSFLSI